MEPTPTRHSLRVRQASNHRSLCDRWLLPQVALDLLALALVMLRSMKSDVCLNSCEAFLYLGAQSSLAGVSSMMMSLRVSGHACLACSQFAPPTAEHFAT